MTLAPGTDTTVQLTLRMSVGAPDEVPNHVTAKPADRAYGRKGCAQTDALHPLLAIACL